MKISIDLNWDPHWGVTSLDEVRRRKEAVRRILPLVDLVHGNVKELIEFADSDDLDATLAALAADRWIDVAARDELTAAYDFLRRVEHRLQMVADEQTHSLPSDRVGLERFARFLGYAGRDDFAAALLAQLHAVQRHYARLFEDAPARAAGAAPRVTTNSPASPPAQPPEPRRRASPPPSPRKPMDRSEVL